MLLLLVVVVFARSIDGRHYYCKDEKNELEKNEGNFLGTKIQSIIDRTKDDDWTAATGRGDAPSASGTGERVRARVLLDGAGKVLQNVRLETVERIERVREEVSRTVHGEIRGRDENDQPSGAETIQPRRRRRRRVIFNRGARAMSIAHENNRHTLFFWGGVRVDSSDEFIRMMI